jgi:hypothetical protein
MPLQNKMADIVFYVPYYHPHSNGIIMLWHIAYEFSLIKKSNIFIYEMEWGLRNKPPHKFLKLLINKEQFKALKNPIVIYPDVVEKNPLKAERVVRYLLARPYAFGNGFSPNQKDYVCSYSELIVSKKILDQFYFLTDETEVFNKNKFNSKKSLISIYYGKCFIQEEPSFIKNIVRKFNSVKVITRTTPDNKDELHKILSQSKLLISYDSFSQVSLAANLLGTPVLFVDDVFSEIFSKFNQENYGYYYEKDINHLDDIISLKNSKRIKEKTFKEVRRIKLNEKSEIIRFHNSILEHFRLIKNKKYLAENVKKINLAKVFFIDFVENTWSKKELFVVMDENALLLYKKLCLKGFSKVYFLGLLKLKEFIFKAT